METTGFFIIGIVLVIAALILSATGLRATNFPSRAALAGTMVVFAALVLATTTFAVLNARDEQENRRAEEAEEAQAEASEEEQAAELGPPPPGGPPPPAGGEPQTLSLTSPADGSLVFEPDALEYENPSPVPHSVAIESPDGETLGASETGANATFTAEAELTAGDYVFYCTVSGHRESGMEGTLTVK
jgi:plastocyanin